MGLLQIDNNEDRLHDLTVAQRSSDVSTRTIIAFRPLLFSLSKHNNMPNARFPPFRCRSSVAVSPFPLAVAYLFAVYGCNGTEFSYIIFTE